ncbi:hypothetical protein EKH79_04125 [Dyella dinghuensis]|uniref:Uncharacterized protein n=1 Tax=Dyella dinghuensis TaxID=1920169 RepID=A0A432LV76_9GAMM|nr:hypothetical protein [Dyella dinghuensis]RUL65900.1 hypothetical protein EKH79_04125 [Dyella dinghuensis]
MAARCLVGLIAVALSLTGAARLCRAQSAERWAAQQQAAAAKTDRIMADVNAHKGLLDQYLAMREAYVSDNSQAFRLLFGQYVSWYQSFLGAYPEAMDSFSIAQHAQPGDNPSPLAEDGYVARPALDAIPELAKNYRIVLFNEAHNIALTRSLTVQLLSRLHDEGFNYFAAETLVQTDTALTSRGYPTDNSGFYTEEPIYAEMVRTALKLGFKVVAYEATTDTSSSDARESEQAQNLYKQVFARDPQAKLVINAGYEHITTSGSYLGGSSMAEHLHKLVALPMLSIDQTAMYPHPSKEDDHPYYTEIMDKLRPQAAIVFVNAAGKPWALRSSYDVNVFFPPSHVIRGRPAWLTLGELRQPFPTSADECHAHYPCLIEARYSNEGDDAIPADRLLLDLAPLETSESNVSLYSSTQGVPSGNLYLRPGSYRLKFITKGEKVVHQENIVVPATPTHH